MSSLLHWTHIDRANSSCLLNQVAQLSTLLIQQWVGMGAAVVEDALDHDSLCKMTGNISATWNQLLVGQTLAIMLQDHIQ